MRAMKLKITALRKTYLVFVTLFILSGFISLSAEERVMIGHFSESGISDWSVKEFEGETDYSFVESDGRTVLHASSNGTASAYYKEISIDLTKTPYLNWSWKIKNVLPVSDEEKKSGDDFPARIYVVFDSGILVWRTKALNYVWASSKGVGEVWSNPFAGDNVKMLALQSGEEHVNRWMNEKRNVRADLKRFFDKDVKTIDGIAIMTDTDNSGSNAEAWFGDISFSEK